MTKVWGILPILGASTWLLYWISLQAPSRDDDGTEVKLSFPSDLESVKAIARVLQVYSERNWWYAFILFGAAYTYKQAFCIPGSGILNILAGALYGLLGGLAFACVFTAVGATLAFIISRTFYRDSIHRFFPERFCALEAKVAQNRGRLFYFMIFIRVVPVSPGWVINLVSPLLDIPISTFFFTTLLGLIPYNFLGVSAGGMITSLTSVNDILTWRSFSLLLCMAAVALVPAFLSRRTTRILAKSVSSLCHFYSRAKNPKKGK